MTKRPFLALVLLLTVLPAQERDFSAMLTPAGEASRFDMMIGAWEGSGTTQESPGAAKVLWTARSSSRRVLGGHFVQEDMLLRFPSVAELPELAFRSYNGFDRENKRYVSIQIGSDGSVAATELMWPDEKTIVSKFTFEMEGKLIHDRWVTRHTGSDRYEFVGYRAVGAGAEFVHVEGRMKRTTAPDSNASARPTGLPVEAAAGFGPVKPLPFAAAIAGDYEMEGAMVPAPGAPEVPIRATETVRPLFGGTVLLFKTKGAPQGGFTYEGVSAMAWDPANRCHKMVYVNNLGEMGENRSYRNDDGAIVAIWSGLRYGTPTVTRTLIDVDGDGAITKVTAHSILGDRPPLKTFSGTYEKAKKK